MLVDLEQRFPGHPLLAERRRAYARGCGPGRHPGRRGRRVRAERPGGQALASEAADPSTHGDLGIAYKQMGLHDAAIEEFKQLAADKTRAVFAYTMIGECVEAKGELGEAVKRYKEALNLPQATPQESIELYYLLGAVFEQLGDVREALYFFENVGKRDPGFRDVEQADRGAQDAERREELRPWRPIRSGPSRSRRRLLPRAAGSHHAALEEADGAGGSARTPGRARAAGGGRTRVLDGGALFEKAGVASPTCTARCGPRWRGRCPARGATSAPPASRSSFTRAARASRPCTPTSATSSGGPAPGSAAAPI